MPRISRLDSVRSRDLRFVGPDERAVAHDLLAADDEPIDPVRPGEDERRRRGRRRRRARDRPSTRRRNRPACRAPSSRCRRGRAQPRRRACRAAAPRAPSWSAGPPRPRATRSDCLTSRKRSQRSFEAEPSTPSPTRTPRVDAGRAHGRDPRSEPQVRGRAVRHPGARAGEPADVGRRRGGRSVRTRRLRRASRACSR